MKKILLPIILILSISISNGQNIISKTKQSSTYLKLLPNNMDPSSLKPSDIPSEGVLKKMGFTDKEIREALDFKFSRGKYNPVESPDTNYTKKFYASFGDTLVEDSSIFPKAKIFGQDIFRNNKLEYFQRALDAKAPENYKIGPGDEISVSVWGYNDFSETLEVDERGYINPDSYGRIYVKGLTFKNMREILKNKFSNFFDMKNSEIDVTLSYSRVITINIVGEVYHPGSYNIPAINTAFNALIASKGPTQLGTVRNIYIRRNGTIVDSLDVYTFLFNPMRAQDIYLQDGDYIFVPPANNTLEIIGAVNRPYTYEAKAGESVADMIMYAGGFRPNAFRDIITLQRMYNDAVKIHDVHKDDFKSTKIQSGDILKVNQLSNIISNFITVKGSVGVSGDYEFVQGEKLLELLKRAKCLTKQTFLEKLYIIRLNQDRTKSYLRVDLKNILEDPSHEDNILLQEFDVIRVLSKEDFDDIFTVFSSGALRSPGEFDYGEGMTLQDLLLQSGGLLQSAEGSRVEVSRVMDYDLTTNKLIPKRTIVKTIVIGDNLILSEDAETFRLKPFDQIFVRSNPDFEAPINVTILGEVKYPGKYSLLKKNEKISSLIARSGGLTDYAFLDGAKLYRRFEQETQIDKNIKIPSQLLDSILQDPDLATMYKENLLEEEKRKLDSEKMFDTQENFIYDVVYLNLEKALESSSSKHNLVLSEGDSIILPKTMDVVHITGALVNLKGNSISAPYFKRRRANYYVKNFAGGFGKANDKGRTIVIYPSGITKKALDFKLFSISPRIKKGSTIRVMSKEESIKKKKKSINWNEAIESAMIKATAILTLWLLIEKTQGD